jgi:hypothetical protein
MNDDPVAGQDVDHPARVHQVLVGCYCAFTAPSYVGRPCRRCCVVVTAEPQHPSRRRREAAGSRSPRKPAPSASAGSASARLVLLLRGNATFLTVLAVAAALRLVVTFAYQPALLFPDSFGYLARAVPFEVHNERPSGYSLFLRPFVQLTTHPLRPVAVVQHLMAMALAVLGYGFLLRRGLPRWAATLPVLPLLFDPLQLVLEQYVLSDVLFECLVVGACLLVLWRHRPGVAELVLSGVLVGCAGFVRGAGTFLLVVFVVALVCLRVRWVKVVAFALAAILPLGAYAVAFHHTFGRYAVSTAGPRFLYARLAPVVDCRDPQLRLPGYERMLCPRRPVGHRPSTDYFMWGHKRGPQWHVHGPADTSQVQVLKDFDKRVLRAEPIVYARAALTDAARGFTPVRTVQAPGYPASYWLFADHYWSVDTFIDRHVMRPRVRRSTGYSPPAAQFLTTYRHWVFTPGPLLAALLVAAGLAALGVRRARESGDRVAVALLGAACVVPLLTAAGLSGFSWRYQLPQMPLLPLAGALGLAAMIRGPRRGAPNLAPPLRILDRCAAWMADRQLPAPVPALLGEAAEGGSLQGLVAVVAGSVAGCLSGMLAAISGWFAPLSAAVVGVGVALVVLLTLLLARARTRSCVTPSTTARAEAPASRPAS